MASGLSSSNKRSIGISSGRRSINASLLGNPASRAALLWRASFFMVGITALMSVCVFRLFQLQVIEGSRNQQLAEENRVRSIPIPADRGNLVDRNGQLLAANRLSRDVYLWPRQQSREQWRNTAVRLGEILDMPAEDIIAKLEQVGFTTAVPVRIKQQITPAMFVELAEQANQLSGVEILAGSGRYYPHSNLASHVLGYIGEATEDDMRANPQYPFGMIVGQTGIERIANAQLEGVWGSRRIEVDARGRELRLLESKPATGGTEVRTTLHLEMQQAAERALTGRRGAAVALDVRTGEVLVMASGPSFDLGMFTRQVSATDWQRLQQGDQPFLNRALQSYPPGSTFKIVTAIAGMQSGKYAPDSLIHTSAYISLGGIQFWEHSNQGYGAIGFRKALAVSSNTFFYQIGMAVGPEAIARWARALGIGVTDVGLDGANHGVVPTPEEKLELYGEPWYAGDTVSMSIGQGVVQITPLEMAVMVGAIANGGWRVQPHLLMSQTNTPDTERISTGIAPGAIAAIKSGLVAAVQEGTAQRLNDGSIPLTAGKTGTSEVVGQPSHAVFVGYGPVSDPQIAVAVIVENGGFGGVTAVPVAHEMYKAYFNRQNTAASEPQP